MEIHAVNARHQCRRQEHHRGNGKYLDDLVLLDIDESQRRVHQEVHLFKQEIRVRHQRIQVAHHFAQGLHFRGMVPDMPDQKGKRPLGIQYAQTHLAAAVFQPCQLIYGVLHGRGNILQHQVTDDLGFQVQILEGVGKVLDFLIEQRGHDGHGRSCLHLAAAGTHAVQAEVRQFHVTQCQQLAFAQRKSHGGGFMPSLGLVQKRRVNVDALAVDEIARRGLDFIDLVRIRQAGGIQRVNGPAFSFGGFLQINPGGRAQLRFTQLLGWYLDRTIPGNIKGAQHSGVG